MYKRKLPLILTFVGGMAMIMWFFIPRSNPLAQTFFTELTTRWLPIIGSFFLLIGLASLFRLHYFKISHQREGWGYSVITFAGIAFMCIVGFGWGVQGVPLAKAYESVFIPLDSTMFSILAFYMASAAFRAFRARTAVATILLVTAFIVMLGRVSFGSLVWDGLPSFTEWIMVVPNMAQKRGILLGVCLGMMATSLKIIFGIERSYLGSKE
ncbi:MAG: hypothetical protein HZA49_00410 [Planctomycetes bacterium]|nr:hypothetical protein [Planctomycetota bacterium]